MSGRWSDEEWKVDAIADQVARGRALATVAQEFGLELRQLKRMLRRKGFSARVEYYGVRCEAEAAMNLTRMFLDAADAVEAAPGRGADGLLEAVQRCFAGTWYEMAPGAAKVEAIVADEGADARGEPQCFSIPESGQESAGEVASRRDVSREVLERRPLSLGPQVASVAGSPTEDGDG